MIEIVERQGDVVVLIGRTARGEVEIITEMTKEESRLTLRRLHIDGPGAGSVGVGALREMARALCRMEGATEVTIYGGVRTTGANPGRTPDPIIIRVE